MRCFKNWCLENFPFIEADIKGLSNYQIMCKLYEYIKNIAQDVANLTIEYQTLIKNFEDLKKYVDDYLVDIEEVKQAIENINLQLDEIVSNVNSNSARIEEVNTNLTNLINENYNILKTYIDNQDNILNDKIDNIQIGAITVYDPTTGTVEPLQTVINNLYGLGNTDGLTANEFDSLDLTATVFDSYEITAYDFDSKGKIILV